MKNFFIQFESKNAVEGGRCDVQIAFKNRDFVTVFEIGVSPGADQFEIRVIGKQLITGRDVNGVAVKCDTAKTTIPPSSGPVYVLRVPINFLINFLIFEVDQENATVAFALMTPAYD